MQQPTEARLVRLEALVAKGVANDVAATAALLGAEKRPAPMLSKLFEEYETLTKDELKDFSPNQLRVWRNSRMRAVENFVSVVGDKPANDATIDDAIDYTDWWRERVTHKDGPLKAPTRTLGN